MSKDERRTGLAFSGGGIRSAAFCSGVLRRMLQKSVPVDYLSCVSGGGFTGSAYLDWKYRNELKDDARWHAEFFENMRKNSNSYCNCRNPCQALFDGFILFFLIFVVTFISPWLTGFSFVIPTAYIVNYFFGDILRAPFTCPSTRKRNFTSSQIQENPGTLTLVNITNTIECVPKFGPHMYSTLVLFVSLFAAFLTLFFLKEILKKRLKNFTRFLFNLVGFTLAMTFLPWFIEEYIVVTPLWANALIIVLSVFLWLGLPPLRDKASVAMIVYFYAYAVKWMVYKTDVLYVRFTHDRFAALMYASGILIWLNPFIGLLQQNAVHIYNRWRLQKSFYSPESVGASGCAGITCQDVIPWCACSGNDTAERLNRPVTFGDIEDVKPQLICNVTAHHWKRTEGDEHSYELLTIAPDVIERIDRCVEEAEFDSTHISPHDVKLSVAMAASAAVVSYDLGKAQSINAGFRDLQILLGLGLGKRMISHKRGNTCLARVLAVLIQFLVALPVMVLPAAHFIQGMSEFLDEVAVGTFLIFLGVLTFIAILPTGTDNPGCLEKFVRWCIVHIYHVRLIREMMGITNTGPKPPSVISLSDGGHRDNLGLLALLKLRFPRIVVVNGGYAPNGKHDEDLLFTLGLAREKLRCSFTGINGRDIQEDLRTNFVEVPPGKRPRSYKFRVGYFEKEGGIYGGERKVGEGEIVLIAPRHPHEGSEAPAHMELWKECLDDKVVLEEPKWGTGPVLEGPEVDRLTGCCCECCHWRICNCCLGDLCGRFPMHYTGNQLFTPSMFSAYHREGYRACAEAGADLFLSE